METLRKIVQLSKLDYYETHLSLLNCLLPTRKDKPNDGKLTPTEIKVLAAFMSIEGELAQYRFETLGRKIVKEKLNLTSAGLSNYTGNMEKKGFLISTENSTTIWPILVPDQDEQMYMFKLINNKQ